LLSNESVASSVSELERQYLERRLSEERTAIKWISTAIFPLNLSTVTVPKPEIDSAPSARGTEAWEAGLNAPVEKSEVVGDEITRPDCGSRTHERSIERSWPTMAGRRRCMSSVCWRRSLIPKRTRRMSISVLPASWSAYVDTNTVLERAPWVGHFDAPSGVILHEQMTRFAPIDRAETTCRTFVPPDACLARHSPAIPSGSSRSA